MPTQLQMLGAPRVFADGRTVAIAWQRRSLDLLTYLFTSRGAQPRDLVAFTLWPDDDEETARAHLRRNLNALRGLLPADVAAWIVADAGIVAFAHDAADTDVAAFEAALDAGDPATAVRRYGGDFAGSSVEPYALTERERLRRRYHAALIELIGSEFSQRRFDAALGYALRIFADEPFREDIVRRLIAIRYAMGDRPGALAEYDRFARSLRTEMQIDPMPETLGLRDLILRGDPLPSAPDAGVASAHRPSGASEATLLPFTGRTRTLDVLRAGWTSAASGAGTAVFVCGEAGIGKTRAVAEFLERVVGTGVRVLRGTTASPEGRPYEALLAAFAAAAPYVPTLELEPVWVAEIAHLVPEIGARVGLPSRVALPADREAARILEAFARFVAAIARHRPTAIVLEDLHWARSGTFDAIRYLATRLQGHRVLVVATLRLGENPAAEALVRDLSAARLAAATTVSRLSRTETLDLLDRLQPPVRGSQAQALAQRSEGHPLFLGELLRSDPAEPHSTPGGIAEVVAARLARCSAEAQLLAGIAAVCGSTFDLDLLGRAAGWDDDPLIDALAELLSSKFVRSTAVHERGSYAFGHALVHEAILARVDERDGRRLHRIIARALESRDGSPHSEAEIARHWFEAGDRVRAAQAYARAADASLRVYARDEAANLATLGLACAGDPELQSTLLKIRIGAGRGRAHIDVLRADIARLREVADALGDEARFDAARSAFEVATGTNDLELLCAATDAMRGLTDDVRFPLRGAFVAEADARNELARGNFGAALARAETAMNAYAQWGATRERTAMAFTVARIKTNQGNFDAAIALLKTIEPSLTSLNDAALTIEYWYTRANVFAYQQNGKATIEACSRVIEIARAAGDRLREGHATLMRAAGYQYLAQLGHAMRELDAALEIYDSIGISERVEGARNNRAALLSQIGRFDEAAVALSELYAAAKRSGTRFTRSGAANNLGAAMLATGRVPEALALHREALAIAREMGSEQYAADALGHLGAAEIAAGDPAAGLEHLREAIDINRKLNLTAMLAHDLARAAGAEPAAADGAKHARTALAIIEADRTDGITLAPEILSRCAAAFARANDDSAAAYSRQRGRALLARRLELIDESDRAFYRALPWHALLLNGTANVTGERARAARS